MPTLTVEVSDAVYRAAFAVDKDERVRRISEAFDGGETGDEDEPALTEEDFAAIGRGLEDLKAGRTIPGAVALDRIRAKYGLRKGNSPI